MSGLNDLYLKAFESYMSEYKRVTKELEGSESNYLKNMRNDLLDKGFTDNDIDQILTTVAYPDHVPPTDIRDRFNAFTCTLITDYGNVSELKNAVAEQWGIKLDDEAAEGLFADISSFDEEREID